MIDLYLHSVSYKILTPEIHTSNKNIYLYWKWDKEMMSKTYYIITNINITYHYIPHIIM